MTFAQPVAYPRSSWNYHRRSAYANAPSRGQPVLMTFANARLIANPWKYVPSHCFLFCESSKALPLTRTYANDILAVDENIQELEMSVAPGFEIYRFNEYVIDIIVTINGTYICERLLNKRHNRFFILMINSKMINKTTKQSHRSRKSNRKFHWKSPTSISLAKSDRSAPKRLGSPKGGSKPHAIEGTKVLRVGVLKASGHPTVGIRW